MQVFPFQVSRFSPSLRLPPGYTLVLPAINDGAPALVFTFLFSRFTLLIPINYQPLPINLAAPPFIRAHPLNPWLTPSNAPPSASPIKMSLGHPASVRHGDIQVERIKRPGGLENETV